jgi:hypothetical protein
MKIGIVFTTLHSKKQYKVIEKHRMFEDVWGCYPAEKEPPYKQTLVECFGTEFINECLKKQIHEDSSLPG